MRKEQKDITDLSVRAAGLPPMPEVSIPPSKLVSSSQVPVPEPCGSFQVQIGRTYGTGPLTAHDFAPNGEKTILQQLQTAIAAAKRFIYIEEQFLIDVKVAKLLAAALGRIEHLTILTSSVDVVLMWNAYERRKAFLDILTAADPGGKVRVFSIDRGEDSCGKYVHAKTWIVDDEFAIIGSANINRRSMSDDSEVAAAIYDPSLSYHLAYNFAHRLRIRLWAHQLGMDNPAGHAELADGVASACHWLKLPAESRVKPYDPFTPAHTGFVEGFEDWFTDKVPDFMVDPGSE